MRKLVSKQLKKYVAIVFAIMMCANVFAYDFQVDGIYYYIGASGTYVGVTYKDSYYNSYSGSVFIPDSVTYNGTKYRVANIGTAAFSECSGLTSVTISNGITEISDDAFYNCVSLTSITIPNSVTRFGERAFFNCTSLTSITIPNNNYFDGIALYTFANCTSLTSITLPRKIIALEDGAFYGCTALNTIDCTAENPPVLYTGAFGAINEDNVTVVVPCEKSSLYQNATGWSLFNNIVEDCESSIDVVEENQILVYPNPAKDNITLEAGEDVFIFNNLGQIVKQVNNPKGKTTINIQDLPKGTYYLKISERKQKLVINN